MKDANDVGRISESELLPTRALNQVDKYRQDLAAKLEAEVIRLQEVSKENPDMAVAYGNMIVGLQRASRLI